MASTINIGNSVEINAENSSLKNEQQEHQHHQQQEQEQQQQQQQPKGIKGILPRIFPNLNLRNPGKFDNHNREAESAIVHMELFEGVLFNTTKSVSEKLATVHAIRMGGAASSYEFATHYATPTTQMMGRFSMHGIMHGNFVHAITPNLHAKITAQLTSDPERSHGIADVEYDGEDFSAKVAVGSDGGVTASLLQSVSKHGSVGCQFYNSPSIGLGGVLVGRYNTDSFVSVASLSSFGIISASYVQKVNEKVSLATTIEHFIPTGKSEVMTGYDYNMRQARVQGRVTSSGTVSCVLEEKMAPGISFLLNGTADYAQDKYSFGYGFTIQA